MMQADGDHLRCPITLDLMIVVATIEHIAVRLISMVGKKLRRTADPAEAADASAAA